MAQKRLLWQSKLIMLLVLPLAAAGIILQTHWWAINVPQMAIWAVGLSFLLGLIAWKSRIATPAAAAAGAAINASLIFNSASFPYEPWQTALVPVVVLLVLTSLATRAGHKGKERRGTAEKHEGRNSAQVAANLGVAMLVTEDPIRSWLVDMGWLSHALYASVPYFTIGVAALAEAAADTVSSELGQLMASQPRMITTLRKAEPGTDGAVSLAGTVAGALAAAIVAAAGSAALGAGFTMFWISAAGGLFGMFFDSLLGAAVECRGWLNNDSVNFLSAASAAAFAFALLAIR